MAGTEVVVNFHVDLIAIGVVFGSELCTDEAVTATEPAVNCRVQPIAATKVVRQRHIGKVSPDEAGAVESRTEWILAKHADRLKTAGRNGRPHRIP